jgi:hypothetical protein
VVNVKTIKVFLNIVCTKIILIVDVENALRNILRLELSYIKKPLQDQRFASVAKKYRINGAWIMIMMIIALEAGSVSLVILV